MHEKKIGIIGWNGQKNVGDDTMTSVIVNYLISHFKSRSRFFLLADESTLAQYSHENKEIKGFKYYNFCQRLPYFRRWINPLIYDKQIAKESSLLIIGGGSIFHSVPHSKRLEKVIFQVRANHHSSTVGALGVSLGPFKKQDEYEACKNVINKLDFIAVRDERSWQEFQSFNIQTPAVRAMDIALLLPDLVDICPIQSKSNSKPALGLALRQGHTPKLFLEKLAQALNKLQSNNPDLMVDLLCFSTIDEDISRSFQTLLNQSNRVRFHPYSDNPAQTYQLVNQCSLVLASRLHAAVIAYAVKTPFGVLSYHQKCIDFANEVGLDSEWIFTVDNLDLKHLEAQLISALENSQWPNLKLPLEEAKQKALQSFSFLDPKK